MASPQIAVIGGGPAGLMAAEVLSARGASVTIYERMPSVGRKFLMAGRGGLNLTHAEDFERFVARYGTRAAVLRPMLERFPAPALIAWAEGLGQETFVGSSGRVFPRSMKASPLLRAWLARLNAQGVAFRTRHDWHGWNDEGALRFHTMGGDIAASHAATVLALGGASWPRLGADGGWTKYLGDIAPLRPANCGFTIGWSDIFRTRFAGRPLKNVALHFAGQSARGDCMVTDYGLEGGAIYALSAPIRDAIAANGPVTLTVDLRPDMSQDEIPRRLAKVRGRPSLANHLRKALAFSALETNLLREAFGGHGDLAASVKAVTLTLTAAQPLARAISTAGGVRFGALNAELMLKARPGTFLAGEMLDWEAPTGGYLLSACFSSGVLAAQGALAYLKMDTQ